MAVKLYNGAELAPGDGLFVSLSDYTLQAAEVKRLRQQLIDGPEVVQGFQTQIELLTAERDALKAQLDAANLGWA